MRILVLGVTGMLGSAVFKKLSGDSRYQLWGTMRSANGVRHFPESLRSRLLCNLDVLDHDTLAGTLARVRPDVVVNCVGLIKQLADAKDPLLALPLNSLLPHRLQRLCELLGARLIHISTDCVFSGRKGMYTEADVSDAEDLYGKSKYLGEVPAADNAITLRTSIIGHELGSAHALVDWFLSQSGAVKGYSRAIFSGLPTVELARVIGDLVIPAPQLTGLYHVSVAPIDKCSLLRLIASVYGKDIEIVPDEQLSIDRSLDSSRFRQATGYAPPPWSALVATMHQSATS